MPGRPLCASSLSRSSDEASQQRGHKQNQKEEEQDSGDPGRSRRNSTKAKYCRYDRDHGKYERPTQQE